MPRAIKAGHYVRTADGAIGRVRYLTVDPAYCGDTPSADVDLGNDLVTLPLGELRRVADPRSARPPIEELPAERPRCAHCDKPLKMWTRDTPNPSRDPLAPRILRRAFSRWRGYGRGPLFCTLSCALHFAEAAHRAGYRIVRPKGGR